MASIHQTQPVLVAGAPLEKARAALILVHGRGASATDIMTIAAEVQHPAFAYLAPQAEGNVWYPNPFTAPLESNEPYLSSAMKVLAALLSRVETNVPAERVILLGFSQGACLTLEFAVRHPRRYGGLIGFSGGLIGPDGTPRDYAGGFDGTPAFLGCSDIDPYIPKERVIEAGQVLERMGAELEVRMYPGMAHTVSPDEIAELRRLVERVGGS